MRLPLWKTTWKCKFMAHKRFNGVTFSFYYELYCVWYIIALLNLVKRYPINKIIQKSSLYKACTLTYWLNKRLICSLYRYEISLTLLKWNMGYKSKMECILFWMVTGMNCCNESDNNTWLITDERLFNP
jgi:hypothetical protein